MNVERLGEEVVVVPRVVAIHEKVRACAVHGLHGCGPDSYGRRSIVAKGGAGLTIPT